MKTNILIQFTTIALAVVILISCQGEEKQSTENKSLDEITLRLEREPISLSPMLTPATRDRYVHEYLFISMGDYDPVSLELIPIMIENLPEVNAITEGPYKGGESYTMRILDEARWSDGSPITGHDFAFTLKMAAHPEISTTWKPLLDDIYDIIIDPQDPKKVDLLTSGYYYLNLEMILTAEIYPAYVYDSSEVMHEISLPELKNIGIEDLQIQYPAISRLAQLFTDVKYQKEITEGAGPYQLHSWETGQYIILDKKENYWGKQFPNNIYLKSIPERLIFQIIPDENVALTLLKNDEIDFMNLYKSPYVVFDELKENQTLEEELDYYTVDVPTSYMILLNNDHPSLGDVNVRQAITLATDAQRMLEQIEGGYGTRINSIVHPSKSIYNNKIVIPEFNIVKANEVLDNAGWKDTNNNNTRDKVVDGNLVELSYEFLITNSSASANISTILKENLSQVGITLNPTVKNFGKYIMPALNKGEFDMSVMANTSSIVTFPDQYNRWHSESINVDGGNYARYKNPIADQQIDIIRSDDSTDPERRTAYLKLQEVMATDYPALFLYTPQHRIAVDEDIEPVLSPKRPGYVANAFSSR